MLPLAVLSLLLAAPHEVDGEASEGEAPGDVAGPMATEPAATPQDVLRGVLLESTAACAGAAVSGLVCGAPPLLLIGTGIALSLTGYLGLDTSPYGPVGMAAFASLIGGALLACPSVFSTPCTSGFGTAAAVVVAHVTNATPLRRTVAIGALLAIAVGVLGTALGTTCFLGAVAVTTPFFALPSALPQPVVTAFLPVAFALWPILVLTALFTPGFLAAVVYIITRVVDLGMTTLSTRT